MCIDSLASTDGDVREIRPIDHVELVDRQGHHHTMLLRELAVRCNAADSDTTLCGYDDIDRAIVSLPPPPSDPDDSHLFRNGALLATAGLVTCTLACGSPYNYISVGILSAVSEWHPH